MPATQEILVQFLGLEDSLEKGQSTHSIFLGFPGGSNGKESPVMLETWVPSLGWEDSLEEGMATHSSILAWRIPGTEEPGGLQSMGLERVRYD